MLHAVKIETEYFNKIIKGKKSYDIRKNDMDYVAGDCIALNEYKRGEYTGRFILTCIVSIDECPLYLDSGYVILQLSPLEIEDNTNHFEGYVNPERIKEAQNG